MNILAIFCDFPWRCTLFSMIKSMTSSRLKQWHFHSTGCFDIHHVIVYINYQRMCSSVGVFFPTDRCFKSLLPFCQIFVWIEMFVMFIFLLRRFMMVSDEEQLQSLPWELCCSFVIRMPRCWHCTRWKLKGGKLFRLIASEDEGNYLTAQPKRLCSLQVPYYTCCYSDNVGL